MYKIRINYKINISDTNINKIEKIIFGETGFKIKLLKDRSNLRGKILKTSLSNGKQYFLKLEPINYYSEAETLKGIREISDLPVPRIIWYKTRICKDYRAFLLEGLSGQILNKTLLANKRDFYCIAKMVGQILAKIHSFKFDAQGLLNREGKLRKISKSVDDLVAENLKYSFKIINENYEWCKRNKVDIKESFPYLFDAIDKLRNSTNKKFCLLHGDLKPPHFFINKEINHNYNVSGIIDWEESTVGNPASDIAHLFFQFEPENVTFLKNVWNSYKKSTDFIPTVRHIANYFLVIFLIHLSYYAEYNIKLPNRMYQLIKNINDIDNITQFLNRILE